MIGVQMKIYKWHWGCEIFRWYKHWIILSIQSFFTWMAQNFFFMELVLVICTCFVQKYYELILVLGFSLLELNMWLQLVGLEHIECWGFSSILASLAVAIFRVNCLDRGFGGSYVALASGSVLKMRQWLD